MANATRCALAMALILPSAVAAGADPEQPCTEDAMIIFDASRSMAAAAGDNTGLRRIDSVRNALARILPRVAPKRRIGLVTYGPGSRPSCANVSLELPPMLNAGERILARVEALKPDGRTPLTFAVRRAAEALQFRDRPVTIVLLTDGEETCDGAPCALAKMLKSQGAHTTVHVISYHIADSVGSEGVFASRCLADETGGLYAETNTVDEVAAALDTALACPFVSQALPPDSTTRTRSAANGR